ncbi:MAG TPA: (d)CMP kinase, partial [Candidatus Hypogeohydataceae bacterium YC40]
MGWEHLPFKNQLKWQYPFDKVMSHFQSLRGRVGIPPEADLTTLIITIDGPAGSGKSTVAKALAKKLGYRYIDTGAFYRAATLKAMKSGVNVEDEAALRQLLKETSIGLRNSEAGVSVLLDNEDVSEVIRTPEVTRNIHYIAG